MIDAVLLIVIIALFLGGFYLIGRETWRAGARYVEAWRRGEV